MKDVERPNDIDSLKKLIIQLFEEIDRLKAVRLWDAGSGKELAVFKGHEEQVNSASFSPDGRRIVSASHDGTVRLWEAATGKEQAVLRWQRAPVFSPDGQTIVSASYIYLSATGKKQAVLRGHEDTVNSVSFSPDGQTIVSVSNDNTVRLWDIRPYTFFLDGTALYSTFIEAVKFLWQLDVQGLEIVHKERTLADMERFGSLLAPPPLGQSKFDQVLEWAEKQQGK